MARVEIFQGGDINANAPNVTPLRAPDFGPGIGPGVEALGKGISDVSDTVERLGDMHDETVVKEGANHVSAFWAQVGYTGPDAYFQKRGKDAIEHRPAVEKEIDSYIAETRAGLKNARQQRLFDMAVAPQRQEWGIEIADHATKEVTTYAVNQSKARADLSAQAAGLQYVQNPKEGEAQLATMDGEIDTQGKLQGWSPEQIADEKLNQRSGVYKNVGHQLVYSDNENGPALARAFVDHYGSSMTDEDRAAVLATARTYQNTIEAEQRRVEAEARRQQSEEKRDARARVETGIAQLTDGIPLSPDDLGSVVADARTTGDRLLIKRVSELQKKNSVIVEHRNDTPAQLQDRLNVVSARIAKEGSKADPADIYEQDALQSLYEKTHSEVANNSLSWGAAHLGIDPGSLNFNDPASISKRMNAATLTGRRLGRPPQVLTNAEAAQYAPILTQGTADQKAQLALDLAKFGTLGIPAAHQIAPDPKSGSWFWNLIGLATNSNAAVARMRVRQVVDGQEALKTKKGAVIDQAKAKTAFNQYVGSALQFFPSAAAGVYDNATAILASDAEHNGWSDWNHAHDRWYAAINMALGAYTGSDGKQYGGLAHFNGATTVLPDGMDQGTFEAKISRANGSQFQKASGMKTPVYANGKNPTASDLKKMQWVPVGDGLYALSDGHAFLHTAEGKNYTIDVRMLP